MLYKYDVILKHDNGKIKISTIAENKKEAIEKVCYAEKAPICAVLETKRGKCIFK